MKACAAVVFSSFFFVDVVAEQVVFSMGMTM
jgi:flagellar biosynthesis protein FliP